MMLLVMLQILQRDFYTLFTRSQRFLAYIVKSHHDSTFLKALEETLCSTFYEDILSDEVYDDDLIRLMAELVEVINIFSCSRKLTKLEFEKAKKHGDLFNTDNFTNKILTAYLKRNECRRYVKTILKAPFLASIRETAKIRLDVHE